MRLPSGQEGVVGLGGAVLALGSFWPGTPASQHSCHHKHIELAWTSSSQPQCTKPSCPACFGSDAPRCRAPVQVEP